MEITVVMVLNAKVLGIVDGLNDGFSPTCILLSVSNANTVIQRLTKIFRSGITFVSRNLR